MRTEDGSVSFWLLTPSTIVSEQCVSQTMQRNSRLQCQDLSHGLSMCRRRCRVDQNWPTIRITGNNLPGGLLYQKVCVLNIRDLNSSARNRIARNFFDVENDQIVYKK